MRNHRAIPTVLSLAVWILGGAPLSASGTDPETAHKLFLNAVENLKTSRYEEAQKGFREILEADKDNIKAHFYLGVIAFRQDRLPDAEAYFQWSVLHAPEMPINHLYLGIVYYAARHWEASRRELESAVGLDPQIALAHYYLGMIAHKQKKATEGLRELRESLRWDPSSPKAHYALAYLLYHDNGDKTAARKEIRLALAAHPDSKLKTKLLKLMETLDSKVSKPATEF